ncbi:MAG: LysM peptidoglycan-binding domain-containing protein [Phycisphaerales bacterium]
MTRENKLALIIGFGLILVIGILVSDHFSTQKRDQSYSLSQQSDLPFQERLDDPTFLTPVFDEESRRRGSDTNGNQRPIAQVEHPGHRISQSTGLDFEENAESSFDDDAREDSSGPDFADAMTITMPGQQALLASDRAGGSSFDLPPPLPGAYTWHTIKPGESLAKIAREKYGDEKLWKRLASFNVDRIPNPDIVPAGVTIRLPSREELSSGTPASPSQGSPANGPSAKKPDAPVAFRTYTVKRGDVLSEIAKSELGRASQWRLLYELNRDVIKDPDHVPAGVTLKIPALPPSS